MYSVTFTEDALSDLHAIEHYLGDRNPDAASNVIRQIKRSADLLAYFPFLGVLSHTRNVRLLLVKRYQYVLPYRVVGDRVYVIAVLHPRQSNPHR